MYSRSILNTIRIALMLICAAGGATPARAQTPTPTPTPSEEELRLLEEKRLTELRRDIEKAKKEIRDAQPQPAAPTSTPLAGETTLDNAKLEAEMVSYKAMAEGAFIISDELKARITNELGRSISELERAIETHQDKEMKMRLTKEKERLKAQSPNLAIYDSQVVKDWRFYQALFPAFEGQVKDIVNQYTAILCPLQDLDPEFKRIFCRSDDSPRRLVESEGIKAQLIPSAIPTVFAAGTNLLKTFIDLAALFRTDTKIEGMVVTIEESALVAEIFRMLKNKYAAENKDINLYYPEVFHPRVTRSQNGDPYSSTVTTIGTLFLAKTEADRIIAVRSEEKKQLLEAEPFKSNAEKRAKLAEQLDQVRALSLELKNLRIAYDAEEDRVIKKRIRAEIAEVKVKLDKLEPEKVLEESIAALDEQLLPTQRRVKSINDLIKRLTNLNERFQSFVESFVKIDANGVNALSLFIKSEDIENALPDGNSYWLEIKSVTGGGNNRIRKNLIRYFTGAKLDHSGGVVLEYTLYRRTGSVIYSDKLSYYEGYVEPKRIKDRDRFRDPGN